MALSLAVSAGLTAPCLTTGEHTVLVWPARAVREKEDRVESISSHIFFPLASNVADTFCTKVARFCVACSSFVLILFFYTFVPLFFFLFFFVFTLCFIQKQIMNIVEGPKLIYILFMKVYV